MPLDGYAFIKRTGSESLRTRLFASFDVDVAVVGGGIAGTTISWLLQEREKLSVALIDPRGDEIGTWYPNYG